MPPLQITPLQRHIDKWRNCKACKLHATRKNVVLCRGTIPCDALFIGEAPGDSEDGYGRDGIGYPFIGPAGRLLDNPTAPMGIIQKAMNGLKPLRFGFTNILACIPLDKGEKVPPEEPCVRACEMRLVEFVAIAMPKLIVCVGDESWGYLDHRYRGRLSVPASIPIMTITHPAAILRAPAAQKSLMAQRSVVVLHNAFLNLQMEMNLAKDSR